MNELVMSGLKNEFENFLKSNLIKANSYHPYYEKALNYMLSNGGKYFRSQLLLGVIKALNEEKLKDAFRVALAIEMIHTYSLIHDDLPIMDNSDLRRGVITTHKKFDEVTALLVGDALNSQAFYEISNANLADTIKVKCSQTLSKSACDMVLGQALDCYFEKKKLDLDELIFLHNHKTGALIAASFKMGAIIAGLDDEKCDEFYKIGVDLGLLFQINDDIIDAVKTEEEAGKPTNHDEVKNSFVNLLGVSKSREFRDDLANKILNQVDDLKIKELLKFLIQKYLKG